MPSAFPDTQSTWIQAQLGRGPTGRAAARDHVFEVYYWPLLVYCRASALRDYGGPQDLVHGFLASRLERDDYLELWRESGLRLRNWLANGVVLHAYERRRDDHRWRRRQEHTESAPPEPVIEPVPWLQMERAWRHSVVRAAMRATAEQCRSTGLDEHWEVFVAHHVDEVPYAAARPGVPAERAAVMARTAARHFVRTLTDLVTRDGLSQERARREVRRLLVDE